MANLAKFQVLLELQSAKYTREMQKLDSRLKRFEKNNNRSLKSISRSFNSLRYSIGGVVAALGVREIIRYADTYKILSNRIRLVTTSNEDLIRTQHQLFQLATETRSSYEGTVELYARIARSSEELGISQERLLEVTKTVNQAIQISGATSAEASAGVVQFGQGLAAGALRGDELRSVLEQMPRLARAIADGMGISIGQLRKLGEEGRLTSEAVIDSLESQASTIRTEFSGIDGTVGQAFQNLKDSAMLFIGQLDQAVHASDALIAVIYRLAESLQYLAELFAEDTPIQAYSKAVNDLTSDIDRLSTKLNNALDDPEVKDFTLKRYTDELRAAQDELSRMLAEGPNIPEQGSSAAGEASGPDYIFNKEQVGLWAERVKEATTEFNRLFDETAFHASEIFDINQVNQWAERVKNIQPEEFSPFSTEQIEQWAERVENVNIDLTDSMEDQWDDFATTMNRALTDTLADAFRGIETSFSDMLQRMAAQYLASGLLQLIGGAIGGPWGAVIGGAVAGRASGGPVSAGTSYIVGEKGPELFTPNMSGMITPNGHNNAVTVNQSFRFDVGLEAVDSRIRQAARPIAEATIKILSDGQRPAIA